MSNATKLDRANKSDINEGTTVPDSNTRGNIYLNRTTGTLYVKINDTWTSVGGFVTGTTTGEMLYWNTQWTAESTSKLFWDNTNEDLHIGRRLVHAGYATTYMEFSSHIIKRYTADVYTEELRRALGASTGVLAINPATSWAEGSPAEASLNLNNHTWLLGEQIYDMNFESGTKISLITTLQELGIKIISGQYGYDTIFRNPYSIIVPSLSYDLAFDPTVSTWSLDTSAPDDGWKCTLTGGTGDRAGIWIWPAARNDDWEILVTYYMPAVSEGYQCILALGANTIGGHVAFAAVNVFDGNTSDSYEPWLIANGGDPTSMIELYGPGATISAPNVFTLGLRSKNGVLGIYDDGQADWRNLSDKFGNAPPSDSDSDTETDITSFGITHFFLAVGHESGVTFVSPSIRSLSFSYTK
jgi:hypothetical protein